MSLDDGIAASGIVQAIAKRFGKDVGQAVVEILERGVDGAANLARAESAHGFVDGNDAADFSGVESFGAEDFDLRINHFAAGRAQLVDFDFAVKDDLLTGLEASFEIAAVKEFAGERAGIVLHEKMIDGVAAVHAADGLAAHDARANGVDIVGLKIFDFGEVGTVFVAKGQVVKEIVECVDAAFGEKFGALRAHTFDHADFGLQTDRHSLPLYHSARKHWFS